MYQVAKLGYCFLKLSFLSFPLATGGIPMTDHIVDVNKMVPPPHLLKKFSEQARVDSQKRGHSGYCKTFAKLCIEWALNSQPVNDHLPIAAWAVLDAGMQHSGAAFEPVVRKIIAAALRAAVDQVVPIIDDPVFFPGNCCERVLKQEQEETRYSLLSIARALEA
jgi:hypothetical protein